MRARRILSLVLSLLILSLPLTLGSCELLAQLLPDAGPEEPFTPTVFTEVTATAFTRTYSDQLCPNEKSVYDAVLALDVGELTFSATLAEQPAICRGRAPKDAEKEALSERLGYWIGNALYAFKLDHPEYFWIDFSDFSYEYGLKSDDDGIVKLDSLVIRLSAPDDIKNAKDMATLLTNALKDFSPRGTTVKEKVTHIDRYLSAHIRYELNAPHRGNLIGALVDGRCVCEGYAHAFFYLCQKSGVDAVCIPGYAKANGETEGHMWNGVFIDGVLYAVDATWNDTTHEARYLLVGSDTEVHEGTFGETHTPDMLLISGNTKPFALPEISETAYVGN